MANIEVRRLEKHDGFNESTAGPFWYQFCTTEPLEHLPNGKLMDKIEEAINELNDIKNQLLNG